MTAPGLGRSRLIAALRNLVNEHSAGKTGEGGNRFYASEIALEAGVGTMTVYQWGKRFGSVSFQVARSETVQATYDRGAWHVRTLEMPIEGRRP